MMTNTRLTVPVYVCIILRKENSILLLHRFNTGRHDNLWAFPGGSIERHETIVDAALREAQEEIGIALSAPSLELIHILHTYRTSGDTLGFYFVTHTWEGEPANKEPDKHSAVTWFDLNNLPHNLSPSARQIINIIQHTLILGSSAYSPDDE
jgi:mutator protein MutT